MYATIRLPIAAPAAVDLEGWARGVIGMHLSIILAFFGIILGVIALGALIAFVRCLLKEREDRIAQVMAEIEMLRPDGEAYPPAGRGMCDRCRTAFEKVYHLSDGRRLCPKCYEESVMAPAASDRPRREGMSDE